ncbi:unnamed protein product, partial [Coregonus sp. 'balchen']
MGLTARLPLCGVEIDNLYCSNSAVVKLSCVDTTLTNLCGFIVTFSHVSQTILILISYRGGISCRPHLITLTNFTISITFDTFNNKSVYFILSLITYLLIITVNLTLIITIIQEKGLHEPMYIFLCSLCVNGLYGTAGFYPKFLLDLQSDVQVISYGGCFTQAYLIYTSVMCEMSTLTVMSYDRIPLCGSRIDKIFCDMPSILKHACYIVRNCVKSAKGRIKFTQTCVPHLITMVIYITVTLFDTLQGWNNVRILEICLKSSKETKQKAFNTCTPHIASLLNFSIDCLLVILQGSYNTAHLPPIRHTLFCLFSNMSTAFQSYY